MFEKEIKDLTMQPYMWGELNRMISQEEYHFIVMDYQKREFDKLPKCKLIFGVCRCWNGGRCGKAGYCKGQIIK